MLPSIKLEEPFVFRLPDKKNFNFLPCFVICIYYNYHCEPLESVHYSLVVVLCM